MANYRYTSDLVKDVLFRAGEPTGGASAYQDRALQYVNRAYQALWLGGSEIDPKINETWWWLQREGTLILPAAVKGSATVTEGSATVSLDPAPASSLAGWHIRFEGRSTVYRIDAHTGGVASVTLDQDYLEASGELDFVAFKIEYDLADDILDGKVITPMRAHRQHEWGSKIEGVALDALWMNAPLTAIQAGVPFEYTQISETKVRFNRYVGPNEKPLRVDYWYFFEPSELVNEANEEPVVPLAYRRILADVATYWLFLDKADARADAAVLAAKSLLKAMQREHRKRLALAGSMGQIYPRRPARANSRGLLRTESGSIIG